MTLGWSAVATTDEPEHRIAARHATIGDDDVVVWMLLLRRDGRDESLTAKVKLPQTRDAVGMGWCVALPHESVLYDTTPPPGHGVEFVNLQAPFLPVSAGMRSSAKFSLGKLRFS